MVARGAACGDRAGASGHIGRSRAGDRGVSSQVRRRSWPCPRLATGSDGGPRVRAWRAAGAWRDRDPRLVLGGARQWDGGNRIADCALVVCGRIARRRRVRPRRGETADHAAKPSRSRFRRLVAADAYVAAALLAGGEPNRGRHALARSGPRRARAARASCSCSLGRSPSQAISVSTAPARKCRSHRGSTPCVQARARSTASIIAADRLLRRALGRTAGTQQAAFPASRYGRCSPPPPPVRAGLLPLVIAALRSRGTTRIACGSARS
jgi:hypothetical protein